MTPMLDFHYLNVFNDAIIARQCNETEIRLVGGQTPDDGRVEICLDGLWGSVCSHRWDIRDAEVVCRQLQYDGRTYASPLSFKKYA